MRSRHRMTILLLAVGTLPLHGCVKTMRRSVTSPQYVDTVDRSAPFLKVHMRDGTLYVLSPWSIDNATRMLRGEGQRFDVDRTVLAHGPVEIPVDSAVLFETNVSHTSGATAALSVITGISLGVTAFCLADTKACFGSCPTFYAEGDTSLIQAEGFSASIAPSLEADDIDHLFRVHAEPPIVRLRMTNEAMETHVVRRADLRVAPHGPGERVFADSLGELWLAHDPAVPHSCLGTSGDCLAEVAAFDGQERISVADSTDLATRETVELSFGQVPQGNPAIVLASRQSLMPTYILYQTLAYMGSQAGTWLAALERSALGHQPGSPTPTRGRHPRWCRNTGARFVRFLGRRRRRPGDRALSDRCAHRSTTASQRPDSGAAPHGAGRLARGLGWTHRNHRLGGVHSSPSHSRDQRRRARPVGARRLERPEPYTGDPPR